MATIKEINKELKKSDPIIRNVEKGLEDIEQSPMDPPNAYDEQAIVNSEGDKPLPKLLQSLKDEHWTATEKINAFEKALKEFKESHYNMTQEINSSLSEFFEYFDNNIINHNMKEEKVLFPLLHERLIASGEHSKSDPPKTSIDLMEDDHNKFLQLGALTFNLLGLASRISHAESRMFIFDTAYNNGRELIELLKLHIFREDNTLFPLANKLIAEDEFFRMEQEMAKY
jgi:iron-sulfur cluster repair protein YtfE (RIC family)